MWKDGMVLKLVLEKLTGQEVCILQRAIHHNFSLGVVSEHIFVPIR